MLDIDRVSPTNSTRNARDDLLWNAVDCLALCVCSVGFEEGQPVCLAVRGNVVAVLTQANMRPRTRQLRLISQEMALEFSCESDGSVNDVFHSSFLFERGNTCVSQSQTLSCLIAP